MILKISSIRAKFFLAVLVPIILMDILGIIAAFTVSSNRYQKTELENISENVSQHIKTLSLILDAPTDNLKSLSKQKLVIDYLQSTPTPTKQEEFSQYLDNFNIDNKYLSLYLLDKFGTTVASTDRSFLGHSYSFRPYFQEAIVNASYTDVGYGVTSKELGYYFSRSVVDNSGSIVGVAVIKINASDISKYLTDNQVESVSDLMLLDQHGVVISTNQADRLYKSIGKIDQQSQTSIISSHQYPVTNFVPLQYQTIQDRLPEIQGIEEVDFYDPYDKEAEQLIVAKPENYNLYIIAEISRDSIKAQAASIGMVTATTTGIMILVVIIVLSILLNRTITPLEQITNMAREVTLGNLDVKNPHLGNDELAILGKTMETMAANIKNKYKELEQLVSQRTEELNSKSESLEKSQKAIVNVLEDVKTAAKELEKFKLAVENASDHIIITDSDGIILFANKKVEAISGFSPTEIIGKKAGCKQLWGGLMPKKFYQDMWKTIKTDKKNFVGEITNKRKNEEEYIAMSTISPIIGDDGEVQFFVALERDITREKEVDRMKTDFISIASHQLRTPLSAMRWFGEMLLGGDAGKLSPDQTDLVKNIYDSNQRLIDLVNSLLNISRIESGRIIIDPIPTDIPKLIKDVLTEVQPKITEKQQQVTLLADPKLPQINIDPKLVRNVYLNILTNAIKYTPKKGKISIETTKNSQEIITKITDSGYGIPQKDQARIFSRFFRASNVVKLETDGTGLGLYLAKAVATSSGGKLWFESQEGKGTTFYFSLPLSGSIPKSGEVVIDS